MTRFRIVAYPLNDSDREAIQRYCSNVAGRDNVVTADVDESNIHDLRAAGIVIHGIDPEHVYYDDYNLHDGLTSIPPPALPEPTLEFASSRRAELENLAPPPDNEIYLIWFNEPVRREYLDLIRQQGSDLLERVGSLIYTIFIPGDHYSRVENLHFVRAIRAFTASDTLDPGNLARLGDPLSGWTVPVEHDALVHRATDVSALLNWLRERDIPIVGEGHSKVRFLSFRGASILLEIANLPSVAAVDVVISPTLSNDAARSLVGVDRFVDDAIGNWSASGAGEVVGVADSGVDENHPDIKRQLIKVIARARIDDPSDTHGHGTHVVGSIVGDGTASCGKIRGIAPSASIVFQSIMDADGRLSGLPIDLYCLVMQRALRLLRP